MAKGRHFSASFVEGDYFRASNGHLPSHSFQKGGRAKGGISPASSPYCWRRREEGSKGDKAVCGRKKSGREEGSTTGNQTFESTDLRAWLVW